MGRYSERGHGLCPIAVGGPETVGGDEELRQVLRKAGSCHIAP